MTLEGLIFDLAQSLLIGVFVVLWYLLRRRDADRSDQVQTLSKRLSEAEDSIAELRVEVAKEYVNYAALRSAIAPIERDLHEVKSDIKKLLARDGLARETG